MPSYKDPKTGKWFCKFQYTDFTGTRKQKMKRGFDLKKDAEKWERDFLERLQGSPEMPFESLASLYLEDKKLNGKISSYISVEAHVNKWILPYFKNKPVNSITPADIRKWQGILKTETTKNGTPLSPSYMQNIFMQLSGIFNFAVRLYGLASNPCKIAGNVIGKKAKSIKFWTKDQFDSFIATFDKSDPYYTMFMILYYTGLRKGELLALTPADIDLDNGTISVSKTFRRAKGEDHILPPKTPKSNRTILIPPFLCDIIREYESRLYDMQSDTLIFSYGRWMFAEHLNKHAALAGLDPIRVHDFRHSHASLLIEMGFSALLVAERLGHENVSVTMDVYSHLFPSKQSQVIDRLQNLFEKNVSF